MLYYVYDVKTVRRLGRTFSDHFVVGAGIKKGRGDEMAGRIKKGDLRKLVQKGLCSQS